LNHHLQINGAIYQEDWKNTIVEFFDPQQGFGNLTFVTNGPNYRVRGGELQVIARASEGLTVQGSASYNKSQETNSPFLINNNPASPNFGKPITNIPNVYGLQGSPLGQSPLFQGNMRARYEFAVGEYRAFGQVGTQYYGPSNSAVGTVKNYRMPGYSTFDASTGIAKDAWNVQFFVQNLANKNASTFTNSYQFITTETVLRPRIAGVKFGYKF
jgi:outer membrane receptor protein involved in Fe transport